MKKIEIFVAIICWIIIVGILSSIIYSRFFTCDESDIMCEYEKLDVDDERGELICRNLVQNGIPYYKLRNMTNNIGNNIYALKSSIHGNLGTMSGKYVGKTTNVMKSVVCDVPVDFYFYRDGMYDYYLQLTVRPIVEIDVWEKWTRNEITFIEVYDFNNSLGG